MSSLAPEAHTVSTDETRNISVDFTALLDDGESLSGSPTVQAPSSIAVSSEQLNATAIVVNGSPVGVGRAVQFTVSATDPGRHTIEVVCSTDAGQVIEGRIKLVVERTLR